MREDLGTARSFLSKVVDAIETNETSIEELYSKIEDLFNIESYVENYDYDHIMSDYFDEAVDKIDLEPVIKDHCINWDLSLENLNRAVEELRSSYVTFSLEQDNINTLVRVAGESLLKDSRKLNNRVADLEQEVRVLTYNLQVLPKTIHDLYMSDTWVYRLKRFLKGRMGL